MLCYKTIFFMIDVCGMLMQCQSTLMICFDDPLHCLIYSYTGSKVFWQGSVCAYWFRYFTKYVYVDRNFIKSNCMML